MTACPHHPGEMGNTLGRCLPCEREAREADAAAGLEAVRAALAAARTHTEPEEDQ